ncbi:Cro/CI family transcriptional regulator [Rickettsiella endosymbiont of Dermanyssus gallinae]|uniref:Cro/CI family transcriptional regulator n=1 Tax=Rickettsiella endosymbiont of Dermanyssus gallinae TaxID=2856608 RepID=UPI001C52A8B1|nr:Cro/CI family transcriptional regulator [Rickettsiella endosymbiont of Dermanyssus gallinae]
MQETTLRKIIRYFGSITKMANKIGVSRTTIYRYLDGSSIPPDIAFRIETKSKGKFNYKALIPWKVKYNLELDTFPSTLMHLPLKYIVIPEEIPYFTDQKNLSLHEHRAICVDENNQLIYGLESIETSKKHEKKTVLAWRISLSALLEKKYELTVLMQTFLISERVAIGIALEKFLGERRGRQNVQNSTPFNFKKGIKTRKLVATYLGFGSHFTYQRAKEIFKQGCGELIEKTDQKKLAISKAAHLAKFTHQEQKNKLNTN